MKAVQMWVADDGELFKTEEGCRKHELDKKVSDDALSQCRVWDSEFKLMGISKESLIWIEQAHWAYAPTKAGREAMNALCREGGYYLFFVNDTQDSTFVEWDDDKYAFIDMETALFEMKARMHAMKNA